MKRVISIDREKCIHCGQCMKDCLLSCIEFDNERFPIFGPDGESKCIACQHCMAICPTGALSFCGKNPDNSEKVSSCNSDDLLKLIKSRRSIRCYKQESLPEDKLKKIVEMLPYCPKGGNVNALHFSIVKTKEKMDEIVKVSYEKAKERSSHSSTILQMASNCYQNGIDVIFRGAPSLIAVSINKQLSITGCENADPIISLSYLDLYAQSLGLGTLWCDFALMIFQQIPEAYSLLNIPNDYTLNYIMLLGTPNLTYHRTIQPEPIYVNILK